MSTTARVLTGLVAGIVIGILLAWTDPALAASVANIVEPFGKLWINALQMTVVPLVLSLVIVGVNQASDVAHSGRVARRAIIIFVVLLTAAATMAAILAPLALSMLQPDPAVAAALRGHEAELPQATGGWASALTAIVPSNAVAAAAAGAMLPLVTFALFFGFALTRIDPDKRAQVVGFFQAISDAMIVIVRWVLWVAPLGVFALAAVLGRQGGFVVAGALGQYLLIVCWASLFITIACYPLVSLGAGVPLMRFAKAALPVQILGFSTQSSLACLSAMIEAAQTQLRLPAQASAVTLPMAVSLFRMTSPIVNLSVVLFAAHIHGVELGLAQLIAGIAVATITNFAIVGLPSQITFFTTTVPISYAMGVPTDILPLLLAIEVIPDLFRTVGNVTADLAVTALTARGADPQQT